jgi:signal transduction histidine kinase
VTSIVAPMTDRTTRVAAPAGLALFALLGVLMTHRPTAVALWSAGIIVAVALGLGWCAASGWLLAVGLVVPTAGLVVLGHGQSANLAWMGLCVIAAWGALTSALPVALTMFGVLAAAPIGEWVLQPSEPGWGAWLMGTAFTTVACVFGRRLRVTVSELQATRAELAARTRAEERSRIAGEVHDVIGHALTVSLLHIGSARLALDDEPDEARTSLLEAERLARKSLEEVRATVGLMRSDDPARMEPLPDAADITGLVESFRRAGAPVELTVEGDLGSLESARGLAAYRIVQEALTNATRHAAGESVTVRVLVDHAGASVSVRNGGTPDPAAAPGSGLLGMRDRAESVGGRLAAGAVGHGWLVEAVLPS